MNEYVIITGASSGIGLDAAKKIAASCNYQVIACVRKTADQEKLKAKNITPLLLDVTNSQLISEAKQEIAERLQNASKVHLINNAGIAISGPVEGVSLKKWREQFEVNVFGLVAVTQAFLPFIRNTKGRIINISSVSGLVTSPYLGPYSASKFAVEAISDALRRELRKFGVKVIILEPGPVATPIWEKNFSKTDDILAELPAEIFREYEKGVNSFIRSAQTSAKTAVPVEQVSQLILQVLKKPTPKTRYIVGQKNLKLQILMAGIMPDSWLDKMVAGQLAD